jgi:hypothetical protein
MIRFEDREVSIFLCGMERRMEVGNSPEPERTAPNWLMFLRNGAARFRLDLKRLCTQADNVRKDR